MPTIIDSYSQIANSDREGYVLNATHADWTLMLEDANSNPTLPISYDLETNYTYSDADESEYDHALREVIQVQASLRPHQAIVSGWSRDLLPYYKALIESSSPKLDYNGRGFDRSYNKAMGIEARGQYIDLMDCLHADQQVRLWNGEYLKISDMVQLAQLPLVMGLDEAGRFAPVRPIGVIKKPYVGRWLRIRTDGGRYTITCTPDHKIHTQRGWQRADELTTTDMVLLPRPGIAADRPMTAQVAEVAEARQLPGEKYKYKYCLSIDHPTHRFFVRGGLVSNCWHHLEPDLPRGLQYAYSFVDPFDGPWKHLFPSNPRLYGAFDVDRPQRLWAYIQRHLAALRHPSTNVSLLDGYWRQVNRLCEVCLDRMQRRGIPVNNEKRLAIWDELDRMAREVKASLQDLIPESLRPPKQKLGLKTVPIFIRKNPQLLAEAEASGRIWNAELGAWYVKREFQLADGSREWRWCQLEEWNPNSTYQVRDYIRWRRQEEMMAGLEAKKCRHGMAEAMDCPDCQRLVEGKLVWKVPTEFRSDKETTDKKELRRLQVKTRDVVLGKVVELREISKMAGTYVGSPDGKQRGWCPDPADGRAHPFFTTAPATGQLSSRDPNAQNFPKHNPKFTSMLRGMIQAPPGYRLVEYDYKAFHVLTTGFEANDPLYMRLARLDMHSFFAATRLLGIYRQDELVRLSDPDLLACLSELKADKTPRYRVAASPDPVDFKFVRDKQAKPTILGYGFGMGAARLYHENQEFMASIQDAQRIVSGLDASFPITCRWRSQIQEQAHNQGYLISRHGYIRRFNSVFRYRPLHPTDRIRPDWKVIVTPEGMKWRVENGDDAEAAIAFLPANDAFGHIKEVMIRLEEQGYGEEFGLINQIHDSLLFLCPSGILDKCLEVVREEMERPSQYLILPSGEGLVCQAEASVGPDGGSWADCKEIKL